MQCMKMLVDEEGIVSPGKLYTAFQYQALHHCASPLMFQNKLSTYLTLVLIWNTADKINDHSRHNSWLYGNQQDCNDWSPSKWWWWLRFGFKMPGKIFSFGPLLPWRQEQLGAWEMITTIVTSSDQQALGIIIRTRAYFGIRPLLLLKMWTWCRRDDIFLPEGRVENWDICLPSRIWEGNGDSDLTVFSHLSTLPWPGWPPIMTNPPW